MYDRHRPPVVIVGLASVVGLQTARSFADAGVPVLGIAGNRKHFAARTNTCDRVIEADVHGEQVVSVLEELGPDLGGRAVLVPATDQAVLHISANRQRLDQWYRIPMSGHATIDSLLNKDRFAELTSRLGMSIPGTRVITDADTLTVAIADLSFPVVVKPAVKSDDWRRITGAKVMLVDTSEALSTLVQRVLPVVPRLVVQEYVQGDDQQLLTYSA